MINPDQYPKFRFSTLSIASLLSLLLLISPSYLFSQDNSPPSPDFNGNGTVDIPDFLLFVDVFGLKEGQERYDAKYDLDGNGEIGIPDFLIFVDNFGKVVNRVPVFTVDSGGTTPVSSVTLSVDENTSSGQPIGDPISATDGDDDTLTYRLSGEDADNFAIDARTGQITTQETYDFEQKGSYSVTVVVSDGEGGEASLVVNITINDIEEPTATVPSNVVVEEGDSKLMVRWDAVSDEEGKPSVTGYEVGYRERPDPFDAPGEDSDEWAGIQKTSNRLDTSVTITGLLNGQAYQVSVRTLVDGGMSDWSSPVLGIPVIPAVGPVFPGGGGGGGGGGTSQPPPPPPPPPPPTPQVTISAGTTPVIEGTDVTFTITASFAPTSALTVNVDVSEGGDVISGTAPSTVTIDANKTSAKLTVATDNDDAGEFNSVITAEVERGTGYTVGSTSSASVTVNDNDTAPWIYNDNVFVLPVTENLAALWTSSKSPPLEDYTARFYEHFNDEFDFLIFYPNLDLDGLEPGSINGAFYRRVKNDVQGIGLETFSHNSSWGSAGKLQGVIFHNYDDPASFRGLLLHESMHRWGNYVVPITSYPYGPHWGFSTSGGYLDCYDISNMIDHGDGKFSAPDPFYFRSSEQYSPIELYLAGFIPPEEVPDFQVAEDGEWLLDEQGDPVKDDKGYKMFTASGFKTHTIEDIIAEHGPRVPGHLQAQKDFRAAVILLVSERYPATRERLERLSNDVTWFSRAGKDESGPPVTNFYEATGGRGAITMDGLR